MIDHKKTCADKTFRLAFLLAGCCLLASWPHTGRAQDCTDLLLTAQELYKNGREREALAPLKACLNEHKKVKKASKETRASAYRLQAMAHLILNEPDTARIATKRMIAYWPFYETEKRRHANEDLAEFRDIVQSLHAVPKFSLGARAGVSLSLPELVQPYSAFESAASDPVTYTSEGGFQGGIIAQYLLTRTLALSLEPSYVFRQWSYNTTYLQQDLDYRYRQEVVFLETPLWLHRRFKVTRQVQPHVQAGLFYQWLIRSNKEATLADSPSREIPADNIMALHHYGLGVGGGFTWYKRRSAFRLTVAWKYTLNRLNNSGQRYINDPLNRVLLYEFYDHSDDLRLHSLEVTLGYLFALTHKAFGKVLKTTP